MNNVCLLGRLVKDPDVRQYGSGLYARVTVAVDRNKEETDFISCVAFDKTAELLDTYFKKGKRIALEGRIQTGSYDDKEGKRHYTTDVVISRIHFCDSKAEASAEEEDEDEEVEVPFKATTSKKTKTYKRK